MVKSKIAAEPGQMTDFQKNFFGMFLRTFYTRKKFTRLSSIGLKKDRLTLPLGLQKIWNFGSPKN